MVLAVFSQKVMRAFWYRISAYENMLHLGRKEREVLISMYQFFHIS